MGFEGLPIFLQLSDSFSSLISNAGALAKYILAILAVLSVVSWTIMLEKYRFFRRSRREGERFRKRFDQSRSLRELSQNAGDLVSCSEAKIVSATWKEMGANRLVNVPFLDKFIDSEIAAAVAEIAWRFPV